MSVRSIGSVVLFTVERTCAAALRRWCGPEAKRLALGISLGRYTEPGALDDLAANIAWNAERASIVSFPCRKLAASMLDDELAALGEYQRSVFRDMIEAARHVLQDDPDAFEAAAIEAARIARAAGAPRGTVTSALRIAARDI